MPSQLKNHPFAVEAFFESSIVITYAFPKEKIQHLIPESLALDTFDDKWGFIAVAMVQTTHLRPKGWPKVFGNNFFLIGYRVFVRHTNQAGKSLRGLYILKSETDKKKMEFFGNLFTHYNYTTTDIYKTHNAGRLEISSRKSSFRVVVETGSGEVELPEESPFNGWREARRFVGPLPFTFTYNAIDKTMLIIEGVRQQWTPVPVRVNEHHFSFIEQLGIGQAKLANAFMVTKIPYHWKKGKIEKWTKKEDPSRAY